MNKHPFYLALIFASLHTIAHAQIFKCKGANDRYTIQDTPCAADASAQDRKRPTPGGKNESFAQRKKDNGPGANWGLRPQIAQESQLTPPQPVSPTQANTIRSRTVAADGDSWQEKDRAYQRRRAEEETKAYNDQVRAENQMHRCNYARQQLGVLTASRPAYSFDNKGDRHYLPDQNRQAEISAAEQRVAEACK